MSNKLALKDAILYNCFEMSHPIKKILVILFCTLLLSLFPLCNMSLCMEKPLKKVSFASLWLPQAQFAGYYVAKEKGFYEEAGLDVTIVNGGPDNPPFKLLEDGKVDFCIMWLSTAIEKRTQGIKLINISQILQRSGLMLVAKRSSGIFKPEDINNKKIGLWSADFEIQPRAFLKRYGPSATIIPQTYTIDLFLRGGVDVASAMWYNEYHTIINSGYDPEELTTFFFYDYGLNSPEDGIYALEETVSKDPGTCTAFAAASVKGWMYAFTHIDETVSIVMRYMSQAHLPATKVHQKWQIERIKDLSLVNGSYNGIGRLSESDFNNVAKGLKDAGLINDIPEFGSFYKDCLIHDKD